MNSHTIDKPEILNPLSMFNNVGNEIEYIVEENNKDKQELLTILNWEDFNSKYKITKKEIKLISKYLELGEEFEDFLYRFQTKYIEKKIEINKSYKETKKIYSKIQHLSGWVKDDFNDGIDKLEDIINFLAVKSEKDILDFSINIPAKFKKSSSHGIDDINLQAWLRRGELDFQKISFLPDFDYTKLMNWIESRDWERNISNVLYFLNLPKLFNEYGIALIYTHYLTKTVYGSVRWINQKPLLQISDKGQDLASCWFTLFHEIGHIILHRNKNFLDDNLNDKTTKSEQNQQEKDANKFANGYLFNGDNLRKEIFAIARSGERCDSGTLSQKYDINPIFVDFWCRKAQNNPTSRRCIPIKFEI